MAGEAKEGPERSQGRSGRARVESGGAALDQLGGREVEKPIKVAMVAILVLFAGR
jgi:hypothetical protein